MAADNNDPKNASPRHRRLGRGLASLMANTRALDGQEAPAAAPAPAKDEPTAAEKASTATDGAYEPITPAETAAAEHLAHHKGHSVTATPTGDDEPHAAAEIDIAKIKPNPLQPRRHFDDQQLGELTESIKVQGVLQPLLLARTDGGYTLIAGERRLRAATLAGLNTVPCVVRQATREQMSQWALTENIQRSDLNPIEKAQAYRQYIDTFLATQQQLAEKLGQPRSTIANHLRLLDLCDMVQQRIADGSLSFGHAKVLAALAGHEKQQAKLVQKVIDNALSVRQLEQLVANFVNGGGADDAIVDEKAQKTDRSEYIQDVERQLTRVVGAKVAIKPSKKSGRGKIVLSYNSLDEFDRITEALGVRIDS